MTPQEILSAYGTVKLCKQVSEDVVVIALTAGFTTNAGNTFKFIKTCTECYPEFKNMNVCITEVDYALVVLKR